DPRCFADRRQIRRGIRGAGGDAALDAGVPGGDRLHLSDRLLLGARRVSRPAAARRELSCLRHLRVLADRQPARGRHRHVRHAAVLLGDHLESGRRQRPSGRCAHAGLAVRPLLPVRARRDRFEGPGVLRTVHRLLSVPDAALARVAALAGDPVSFAPSRQWLQLLLVIGLAFGVAGFTQAVAERHSMRWDLTPSRSFSISEVTRNVLGRMADPIEVVAFTSKEDSAQVTDLMGLFRGAAPNFTYELVDLDRHPGRARQEGVDRYGKAVLRYHEQKVIVDAEREQAISAGLTLLLRGRPTRVLFLDGHGERPLQEFSAQIGYGQFRQALEQESDQVGTLNLLKAAEVPQGSELVIVAGPKNDV